MGFSKNRLICAGNEWILLGGRIRIHPTPAAHPIIAIDNDGFMECVGYIIEVSGRNIFYHSGDTFLVNELVKNLSNFALIKIAILPVNEHNYFKENLGILGNMGIRDAFYFAKILQCEELIPMHWDMFKCNSVFKEQISLLYDLLKPKFKLNFL
jgi:L-ascorbate 6-phosphate lactonase